MNKTVKKTAKNGKGTNGKFLRGNKCSNGRKKGSKGKFTDLKNEFLKAFYDKDGIGGAKGIKKLIKNSPRNKMIFLQMISKMLPTNVNIEGDLNVTYQISEKFIPKKGNEKI